MAVNYVLVLKGVLEKSPLTYGCMLPTLNACVYPVLFFLLFPRVGTYLVGVFQMKIPVLDTWPETVLLASDNSASRTYCCVYLIWWFDVPEGWLFSCELASPTYMVHNVVSRFLTTGLGF